MQKIVKSIDTFYLLFLVSALILCASSLLIKPKIILRSDYLAPPEVLKNLSAGLKTQAADSFWLRAVQDFDFCDQPINERECKGQSWLYLVVDTVVGLDSKFLDAYFYGGLALTIMVNDFEGATKIFDKGVKEFPDDWHLSYIAAYHALYEEKDKLKASKLYLSASENGAPSWTRVLAGSLAVEGGDEAFSRMILEQMIVTSQEPVLVERLKKKLERFQK